jgi:hypothetical protein
MARKARVSQTDIDPAELVRQIEEARAWLAPLLPDVDPGDLVIILDSLFRPIGTGRRFFLRQVRPGVFVP